jgi:hypothetical protein
MTVANGVELDLSLECPNYGDINVAAQGAANRVDGTGVSAIARPTAGAVTGGDATDYRPIFWARDMTARFTRLHCGEFAL